MLISGWLRRPTLIRVMLCKTSGVCWHRPCWSRAFQELCNLRFAGLVWNSAQVPDLTAIAAFALLGCLVAFSVGLVMGKPNDLDAKDLPYSLSSRFIRGCSKTRFPGCMALPVGMLLFGIASSATTLVAHGSGDTTDSALPVTAAFIGAVYLALLYRASMRGALACAEYLPLEGQIMTGSTAFTMALRGTHEWKARAFMSDGAELDTHHATWRFKATRAYFSTYRSPMRVYYCVDVLITVVVAVLTGARPLTMAACQAVASGICAANAIAFLVAVVTRPYNAPAKNGLLLVVNLLVAVGSGVALAGLMTLDATWLQSAQLIGLVASYTSCLGIAVAAYSAAVVACIEIRQEDAANKRRKAKSKETEDAAAVNRRETALALELLPAALRMPLRQRNIEDSEADGDDDDLDGYVNPLEYGPGMRPVGVAGHREGSSGPSTLLARRTTTLGSQEDAWKT